MLRSDSLFGKRDNNSNTNPPLSTTTPAAPGMAARGPLGATAVPATSTSTLANNKSAETANVNVTSQNTEQGSKLIVGPNIKLKGVEITDCDTLVVEGRVEATMDSRVMQIAENGAFKGTAGIDIAEIRGEFDGELTVREKLVIHSTGRVSGKIRYGKLVIEEGGQLSGEIAVNSTAAVAAKPKLNVA